MNCGRRCIFSRSEIRGEWGGASIHQYLLDLNSWQTYFRSLNALIEYDEIVTKILYINYRYDDWLGRHDYGENVRRHARLEVQDSQFSSEVQFSSNLKFSSVQKFISVQVQNKVQFRSSVQFKFEIQFSSKVHFGSSSKQSSVQI